MLVDQRAAEDLPDLLRIAALPPIRKAPLRRQRRLHMLPIHRPRDLILVNALLPRRHVGASRYLTAYPFPGLHSVTPYPQTAPR